MILRRLYTLVYKSGTKVDNKPNLTKYLCRNFAI